MISDTPPYISFLSLLSPEIGVGDSDDSKKQKKPTFSRSHTRARVYIIRSIVRLDKSAGAFVEIAVARKSTRKKVVLGELTPFLVRKNVLFTTSDFVSKR